MVWHEKINSLYIGIYELETISHLRVGSGEKIKLPTPIDNPQSRILMLEPGRLEEKWYIYIPASSLHGVIRSSLETYLRTSSTSHRFGDILNKFKDDLKAINELNKAREKLSFTLLDSVDDLPLYPATCYTTFVFDKCEIPLRESDWKGKYFSKIGRSVTKNNDIWPYMCYVCQTFGASGFRGRVRVLNGYPSKKTMENLPLEIITRTAINRVTGAVEEGALFDLEAIPPGTRFYFAVIIENAFDEVKYLNGFNKEELLNIIKSSNDDESISYLDLFKIGLSMISKGLVNIGAHGTLGFGYVSLKEKCSLSISDNINKFVKMFLKNKYDNIYKEFKEKLSTDKTNELDIVEEYYPAIIGLLVNLYRKASKDAGK